jgi:hypothetical protein
MLVSFSPERERDNRRIRRGYADTNVAITPADKDFLAEIGITRRSA